VCPNYDFCPKCYVDVPHEHMFLRHEKSTTAPGYLKGDDDIMEGKKRDKKRAAQ